MDPLVSAVRDAASPALDAVPLLRRLTPADLASLKFSLLKGLSDACVAGISLPVTLAAATAAHAGLAAATEEASARAAAPTAGGAPARAARSDGDASYLAHGLRSDG